MITLISASAARKESELNMKFAAAKQWEEIGSAINTAVRAGEFELQFKEKIYKENYDRLKELGYTVKIYTPDAHSGYWSISWY